MHVKICVDCGEEYRPEIAVCADCGGRLEERSADGTPAATSAAPASAPEGAEGDPEAEFTESVAHTERAVDLRVNADRLVEAGIEFRMRAAQPAGYRLVVAAGDREAALAALGFLVEAPTDDAKSCPACGTAVSADVVDCPECGLAVGFDPEEMP